MKSLKVYTSIFLILLNCYHALGQKDKRPSRNLTNNICDNPVKGCEILKFSSNLVCTTGNFVFNPIVDNNPCVSGNVNTDYGCLLSTPNQTWIYFTVNEGSNLFFEFVSSTEQDVDAAIWGPFSDLTQDLCQLTESAPISCDFDSERPNLQILGAGQGQKYLLLVTNFDNTLMDVTISQPTGGNVTYCYPSYLETKLVSCFPFDNNILDQKNVNYSNSGGFQFVSDQENNPSSAIYLNGSQYIEYNGIGLTNDSYSYSLWVKPASLPSYNQNQTLLSIGNTQVLMISNNSNTIGPSIYFWGYNSKGNNTPYLSHPISNNNWMHIVVVRSKTKMKIYLNGILSQEATVNETPGYGFYKLWVGIRSLQDRFSFTGAINDLKLFKGVLTDTEITNLYSSSNSCNFVDTNCIPVYPATGNISGNTRVTSEKGIVTLNSNLVGPSNIIYSSGGFIELNPGFKTSDNTVFIAEIDGCGR
ncbi:MAG: LamG domain-containing protein [Spirosomataceae bacterium]|jgi:hypothetical protein